MDAIIMKEHDILSKDYTSILRHKDPVLYPLASLAFYLFRQFDIVHESTPDFNHRSSWSPVLYDLSNHTLCHKVASDVQPTRALFWIVGDIDSHCLSNAQSYDTWSVNIRLSASTNSSLNALLMIGPCKAYTAPARYSILRAKATLKTVLGELLPAEGEDDFAALENGPMPVSGYDVDKFNDQTTVAIEVSVLGYHMDGRDPGFSVAMQGIYHLGTLTVVGEDIRDLGAPKKSTRRPRKIATRRRAASQNASWLAEECMRAAELEVTIAILRLSNVISDHDQPIFILFLYIPFCLHSSCIMPKNAITITSSKNVSSSFVSAGASLMILDDLRKVNTTGSLITFTAVTQCAFQRPIEGVTMPEDMEFNVLFNNWQGVRLLYSRPGE
ncbi:hypothetical protein V8E54_013584 [Elaphomyces granulatus]